jgi:hypothetical protein
VCGWRVSALTGGLTACCLWVRVVPRSGSVGLVWGGQHLFMALRCGNDMTKPLWCGTVSERLVGRGSRGRAIVRPREVWTVSTATSTSWSGRRGRVHCQVQGHEFILAVSEKKETEPSRTPSYHHLTSGWGCPNRTVVPASASPQPPARRTGRRRTFRRRRYVDRPAGGGHYRCRNFSPGTRGSRNQRSAPWTCCQIEALSSAAQ